MKVFIICSILFISLVTLSQYPRRYRTRKTKRQSRLKKHKANHQIDDKDRDELKKELNGIQKQIEQLQQTQVNIHKKLKKKSNCDLEKESICGDGPGIVSLKNVRDDDDCYLVLNYCKTSEDCKFQSMTINHEGDLVKKVENGEISEKKCEWVDKNSSNSGFFVKVKAKLFDEPLIVSFMKLVKQKNFNEIMASLERGIGGGGTVMGGGPMWINDKMTVENEYFGPPEDDSMGPLERSQAEQRKNQHKTPIGVISRRTESNPHYQKYIYADKKRLHKNKHKQI